MEIQLVLGPNGSGKSLFAENLAVESGSPRIYLATMIPTTEDNHKRIEKHRIQRQEKGFTTIEAGWNIHTLDVPSDSVILLEDASNLLANGIFTHHSSMSDAYGQITDLASRCRKLIIVSIDGLTAEGYDKETTAYINSLNQLNGLLSRLASAVYSMQDGVLISVKK